MSWRAQDHLRALDRLSCACDGVFDRQQVEDQHRDSFEPLARTATVRSVLRLLADLLPDRTWALIATTPGVPR